MKYTHIIWDFNGTLLDDVDACIRAVNKLLRERSLKTLDTKEEYRRIFKFPIKDYYRDVGFDFESEPYEVLAPLWMALYNEYTKELNLCAGAIEALEYFKTAGLRQVILSASERGLLLRQLRELGIADYFDEIMALDNIHAYSKAELGVRWRERNAGAVALMVGDSDHDAAVARAMGADCTLVLCGHQSRETLEKTGASLCRDLTELVEKWKNKSSC